MRLVPYILPAGADSLPEQGPTVHYTLQPGEYDVVVESLSEPNTRPWTGHWSLGNGDRYESCFYIMKTYAP